VDELGLVLQIGGGSSGLDKGMSAILAVRKIYNGFARAASTLQSPFLLAVRLYWGWQFAQTGWGKLHNISHVIEFFTSLNIPFPTLNAYATASLEGVGGVLLLIGLGSRLIALPLTIEMSVAYLTADREALHSIFSDPGKFYTADTYTFFFASLLILVFGPGKIAIDTLVRNWADRRAQGNG